MAQIVPEKNDGHYQWPCPMPQMVTCPSSQAAESLSDAPTPHVIQNSTNENDCDVDSASSRDFSDSQEENNAAEEELDYGEDLESEVASEESRESTNMQSTTANRGGTPGSSQLLVLHSQTEEIPSRTLLGPEQPLHPNMQFVQQEVPGIQSRGLRGTPQVPNPQLLTLLQSTGDHRQPAALQSEAEGNSLPSSSTGPLRRPPNPRLITVLQPAVGSGPAARQQRNAERRVRGVTDTEEDRRMRRMPSLWQEGMVAEENEAEEDVGLQHSRGMTHSELIGDVMLIRHLYRNHFNAFLEEQDDDDDDDPDRTRVASSEGSDPPSRSSSGS